MIYIVITYAKHRLEGHGAGPLLLIFPPAADQMDEWRATIQSLIGFAEAEGS